MPDKPAAELSITLELVRALVSSQVPDSSGLHLAHVADGWDCAIWRLGEDRAVRLPRRAVAAPLVLHEQEVLPSIAERFAGTGVAVPAPLISGRPEAGYPWHWSVVPWFKGTTGLEVSRSMRTAWAGPLARTLGALHQIAPSTYPRNPYRGVPFANRADAVQAHLERVTQAADRQGLHHAKSAWDAALEAEPWSSAPVWIHGDLHPGNLIARAGVLIALIDFGDVTAGDPSYDLAIAWLAFDAAGRRTFIEATLGRYDAATWVRARGWAAAMAIILLDRSDDDPAYTRMGADALRAIAGEDESR